MKIQIKKSKKPVEYNKAINFLEQKLIIMKKGESFDESLFIAIVVILSRLGDLPLIIDGGSSKYVKNPILESLLFSNSLIDLTKS